MVDERQTDVPVCGSKCVFMCMPVSVCVSICESVCVFQLLILQESCERLV